MLRSSTLFFWSQQRTFFKNKPQAKTFNPGTKFLQRRGIERERVNVSRDNAKIADQSRRENIRADRDMRHLQQDYRQVGMQMSDRNIGGNNNNNQMAAARASLEISEAMRKERKSQRTRHFNDAHLAKREMMRRRKSGSERSPTLGLW